MEKFISVIVPCYNAVAYLNRCVDSLLAQTIGYEHLEMIFVNDASTDNTLDVLLGYEKKYEDNIKYIRKKINIYFPNIAENPYLLQDKSPKVQHYLEIIRGGSL